MMSEDIDFDYLLSSDSITDTNMVSTEAPITGDTADLSTTGDVTVNDNDDDDGFAYYQTVGPMLPTVSSETSISRSIVFRDVKDSNGEAGLVGLRNLGNTCFMNSGIQCLLNNPRIVQYFLLELSLDSAKDLTITGRFATVLKKCWSGKYSMLHPSELKETVGLYYPQFQDYRQHDCQEFLALLLDNLHEQLNNSQSESRKSLALSAGISSECSSEESTNDSDVCRSGRYEYGDKMAATGCPTVIEPAEKEVFSEGCVSHEDMIHSAISPTQSESLMSISENNDNDNVDMSQNGDDVRRLPSFEDICMKDNKTLNTNVLAADGDELLLVATDSSKFHKPENINSSNSCIDDNQLLSQQLSSADVGQELAAMLEKNQREGYFLSGDMAVAGSTLKPCKETNLLANIRDKFSDADSEMYKKKYFIEHYCEKATAMARGLNEEGVEKDEDGVSVTDDCGNIKRMRIDSEKNGLQAARQLAGCSNVLVTDPPTPPQCNDISCRVNNEIPSVLDGACSLSSNDENRLVVENNRAMVGLEPVACSSRGTEEENHEAWRRYVNAAERAWNKYMSKNESVIVSTFQGQFKSTVVCAECHHVSVTFEPFMYLSVPLPHAMERQICVTYMSCDNKIPVRYMLTVNKQSVVKSLKSELLKQIGEESCEEIIIAEVLNHHISRILEDGMQMKAINDRDRVVYAFEMLSPPPIEEPVTSLSANQLLFDSHPSSTAIILPNNASASISSAANSVAAAASGPLDPPLVKPPDTGASAAEISAQIVYPVEPLEAGATSHTDVLEYDEIQGLIGSEHLVDDSINPLVDAMPMLNNQCGGAASGELDGEGCRGMEGGRVGEARLSVGGEINWQHNELGGCGTAGSTSFSVGEEYDPQIGSLDFSVLHEDYQPSNIQDCEGAGSSEALPPGMLDFDTLNHNDMKSGRGSPVMGCDAWKSCAICLEEMDDASLFTHPPCGCTLCGACIELLEKNSHTPRPTCPVCSQVVEDVYSEFIQLTRMGSYKPKTRILSVPVVYRSTNRTNATKLFGHPNIIYLPSNVSGETVYQSVDRFVPCNAPYVVVLTDGQGLRCSRCLFTNHCTGCEVSRDGSVSLQPSDHLAVVFSDLSDHNMDQAAQYVNDKSVERLRSTAPLSLYDCFKAFTESEVLDEHNPWFCPRCRRNRCANKTMTVWRYPDTLIVYLKRFVYHELSSTKIDNEVEFPLENLNLSEYASGPRNDNLTYDLQSCVCHFGGANSGHYTAFARHAVTGRWYYFNDETFVEQTPCETDRSSAYVLFYKRRGGTEPLQLPHDFSFDDEPASPDDNAVTQSITQQSDFCPHDSASITDVDPVSEEERTNYNFYS